MKDTGLAVLTASLLLAAAGSAFAADPAAPTAAAPAVDQAGLEARLDAARDRLDQAAQEVAELSAQLGGPLRDQLMQVRRFGAGRALLGVQVDPDSKGGARVLEVSPGGAAAEAGVRSGDLIVSIDGQDLRREQHPARALVERMRELKPEQKVQLQVLRAGSTQSLEVTPRPMPVFTAAVPMSPGSLAFPPTMVFHDRDGTRMFGRAGDFGGMELATLSDRLGRYFGVQSGVLVVRAGTHFGDQLQDGDVILAIDGREPTSAAHATRILRSYQRGEKLSLKLMRDRKSTTLDVALPSG